MMKFIRLLIILGFNVTSSYSQPQAYLDSLIQVLEIAPTEKDKIEALIDLSTNFMNIDPNKGLEYANTAIILAKKLDEKKLLAEAYNVQGGNWMRFNNYDNALSSLASSQKLYMELGAMTQVTEIIGNVGSIRKEQGDYVNALKCRFMTLSLYDPKTDMGRINKANWGIGAIFFDIGKYEEALKYYSLALKGFIQEENEYGIARCKGNMASTYCKLGRFDLAIENFQESIAIHEKLNTTYDLCQNLSNLSNIYNEEDDFDEAIAISQRALKLSKEYNYPEQYALSAGNIGSYYMAIIEENKNNNNPTGLSALPKAQLIDSAMYYLKECTALGIEVNGPRATIWAKENLSYIQAEAGQLDEAYYNYKDAIELKDSIFSLETKSEIEGLVTEREIALKNKQIELDKLDVLKKRNERLYFGIGLGMLFLLLVAIYRNYKNQKKSNVQLSSTNTNLSATLTKLHETQEQLIDVERQKEKALIRTRISQDIHDDISSNLTKISWLSEMMQSKANQTPKNDMSDLAQKINESSSDTVSKLGEIIWSTNPQADNLDSLLSYMRSHLNSFLEDSEIKCSINFPEEALNQKISPELRRNLFLILKEAVNNAFKYSQAESLQIDFTINGDYYELSIADNGLGFVEGESKGSGNGMKNMLARINKVKGTLQVNSAPGKGTVVKCNGLLYV